MKLLARLRRGGAARAAPPLCLILLLAAGGLLGCAERGTREERMSAVEGAGPQAPVPVGCREPAEGCACAGNQVPIPCRPDEGTQGPQDAGAGACLEGTRYCRQGRFGACEQIVSYAKSERAQQNALVDPRAEQAHCSDCDPICFRVPDTFDPADGPLDSGFATGLKYHSSGGGVTLAPKGGVPSAPPPDGGVPAGSLYLSMADGLSATDTHQSRVNPSQSQIYLLFDQSLSMAEETQWVYDRFDTGTVVDASAACTDGDQSLAAAGVAGALRCLMRDPQLGLGMFRDLPFEPYATDQSLPASERTADALREIAYANLRDQSPDLAQVKLGLTELSVESSGNPDLAGSQIPALHALASGQGMFMGISRAAVPDASCPAGRFGYPCFPSASKPIVVLVTDSPFHNGPDPSTYPYDYDPAKLGMQQGTTPGLISIPGSTTDWASAFMLSDDAAITLSVLHGSTAASAAAISPSLVGCQANANVGDAVIRFELAAPGHVNLSTEQSSFPTALAVFDGLVTAAQTLPDADHGNELFSSAYALGSVAGRELVVHGDTSDPAGVGDMTADYQGSLFGASCGANTLAPDAVFKFDVPSGSGSPTKVELSLDMGAAHPVLSVYEEGAGLLPRWPALTSPLTATGNIDAYPPHVRMLPDGAGYEYLTVTGDTSTLASSYDVSVLGTCNPDSSNKDAAFKFHVQGTHTLRFDTEGSSFDTVLSLHSTPPLTKAGNAMTLTAAVTHQNRNESAASAYATGPVNGLHLVFEGDTSGMAPNVDDSLGCGIDNACSDALYAIELTERTTLRLQVSGTGYQPGLIVTRADPAGVSGRYPPIALGENHTCALSGGNVSPPGGNVYCWGADDVGQLGNGGAASDPDSIAPVQVTGVTGALQVAAGRHHSCAVTAQGNVYCWGAGGAGQLGDGNTTDRYAPVEVQTGGSGGALGNVAQVACGDAHCCALLHSGATRCWGDNSHGQLGDGGGVAQSSTPVAVASAEVFEQIAANDDHTCAIRASDDAVFCWGSGSYGKLGNGATADNPLPGRVSGLRGASYLMAGHDHNCAVQSNGHVSCWGRGEDGRLGRGDDIADHSTPVDVLGSDGIPLANARAGFAAGRAHSCVVMLTGLVECWGDNTRSQIGNAGAAPSLLATPAYDILDAVQVAASVDHSCALRADGSILCWGDGAHGKLGNGGNAPVPRPVPAQSGTPHVSFGTGTLDAAFTQACGAIAQPPELGCRPWSDGSQNYFFCKDHPRTFAGAAQACAAVGYQLAQIDATGKNGFIAGQVDKPTWIGAKRTSSADWLNLSPELDFEDLDGRAVWHTEQVGHDDCSSGPCSWVPTRGFFTALTFDLVDSEPWTPASTWIRDDQPSSAVGQNCTTIDPNGKWATDSCAAIDPLAPWLPDASSLVANSLAGRFAAPGFSGGVEHDYACEQRVPFTEVTLDAGKYFITVKGGDDGMTGNLCAGAYALHIDDLGSPSGGYITCNDDSSTESTTSVIERTLTTGDYYLILKGWGAASEEGPYRLTLRDLDAVHTNELACDLGSGPGDPATISFAATPGKSYYALIKGDGPLDKGAYTLDLRDQGRAARLACDAGSGPDGASLLSLDLGAGTYYAVLTGRAADAAGDYRLTLGGAPAVDTSFVPPSYAQTVAALSAGNIRVGAVLSCDPSNASCADAKAQATQLAQDTRGVLRVAASAADVPTELVKAVQLLEALDSVRAQLLFTPDSNPGFVKPTVEAVADPNNLCMEGSDVMSFSACAAGATPSFSVSLTNPALRPVPPAPGPLGAYQFTLRVTGVRDGDTVLSEDVPVLVAPTGATPPMTYTTGRYQQDFSSRGCMGNQRPSWDRLTFDADVRPDTRVAFYACSADSRSDLDSCNAGAPSSGYRRVVTITAGSGNGTPCSVATADSDCPGGYCSQYTGICNYLEGATCTQDAECPGTSIGRCRPGASVATLGYTCEVKNSVADPMSALRDDNYRVALRVRFDLESLGDGSRTPSVFFWETQYHCRSVE